MPHSLVRPLFDGPLDVVGDIHGEIGALRSLLSVLGYRDDGTHPGGRRLVFVGDLCDRGPDSPAVIELVQQLVESERAQCLLGNHELNILRGDGKPGNRWFVDPDHEEQRTEFAASKPARNPSSKQRWAAFFSSLPVALERPDLRVVHAAWDDNAIAALRRATQPALAVFDHHEQEAKQHLEKSGLADAAKAEKRAHGDLLGNPSSTPPLLAKLGLYDEQKQSLNPVRVVTSGLERLTTQPFWANGSWRMCDRVKWWDEYTDSAPVIFGHYWRGTSEAEQDVSAGKPDLFDGYRPDQWAGRNHNLFCADFSVGGRYRERRRGVTAFTTRLAAVRWPEREIVFDDPTSR